MKYSELQAGDWFKYKKFPTTILIRTKNFDTGKLDSFDYILADRRLESIGDRAIGPNLRKSDPEVVFLPTLILKRDQVGSTYWDDPAGEIYSFEIGKQFFYGEKNPVFITIGDRNHGVICSGPDAGTQINFNNRKLFLQSRWTVNKRHPIILDYDK